ncbi:MAG: pyrimidine 5'-nucleotidase [Anaerolineae bacterium]|nr:pyrimidine 5'-nucleotidase [Anaerolineales bacterium]MCQ3974775.1 pyrimidine 5'-nucleotidase [Anaerolineae bacterium]
MPEDTTGMKNRATPSFEYILFDLDETLYPRECGLMTAIVERILQFMVHKVGIPADDVLEKKLSYNQQHGTALRGLMHEYQIDPLDYLAFVHDINLADFLGASPPLNQMLYDIPLRKIIFTNADHLHAERVLNILQVRPHFEQIIDITNLNYKNKPDPLAYQYVLDTLGVPGERCIMVEDSPRNLLPAKDMGMTTVLVGGNGPSIAIDYAVPTIFHVGPVLKNLLMRQGH